MGKKLDATLLGVKGAKTITGAILPVFQKEDLEGTLEQVVQEHQDIRDAIAKNPNYSELLRRSFDDVYRKYRNPIRGAKFIDTWDQLTSGISIGLEAASALTGAGVVGGEGVSIAEEVIELAPKLLYMPYYTLKTGDLAATPYWLAMEAASFLPFGVGDLIDMKKIYLNRARKRFRKAVAERFRESIISGRINQPDYSEDKGSKEESLTEKIGKMT